MSQIFQIVGCLGSRYIYSIPIDCIFEQVLAKLTLKKMVICCKGMPFIIAIIQVVGEV